MIAAKNSIEFCFAQLGGFFLNPFRPERTPALGVLRGGDFPFFIAAEDHFGIGDLPEKGVLAGRENLIFILTGELAKKVVVFHGDGQDSVLIVIPAGEIRVGFGVC